MRQPRRHEPVPVVIPTHGVFALESHHARGFQMKPSRHDFLEIFYVLNGRGRFFLNSRVFPGRRGDILFVPQGTTHRIDDDHGAPLSLYGVCVTEEVLRHDRSLIEGLRPGRLQCRKILDRQIESDLRSLLFEQTFQRSGSGAMMVGITLKLLGTLHRANLDLPVPSHAAEPEKVCCRALIRSYVRELDHRFFERTDLDRAAERLGMSRRRFTQLFREETGIPWLRYVHRLRIQYACRLLQETRESIEAIAFSCGYENLSSFYRIFKRLQGASPDRWRNGGDGLKKPSRRERSRYASSPQLN